MKEFDRVIIGAGIYGLYAAYKSAEKGYNVAVLEADNDVFLRGSFINQARLHSGYHYPRSVETAAKSRDYFFRFINDFSESIYSDFKQIYAISSKDSKTTAEGYKKFCDDLNIKCVPENTSQWFKDGMVDGAWDTLEYAIDRNILASTLVNKCKNARPGNVTIFYNHKVTAIEHTLCLGLEGKSDFFITAGSDKFKTSWVLNATYGSVNQILRLIDKDIPLLPIKYELCEILLCNVSSNFKNVGITVMDGPFFSIMPFGRTGMHSLTSVVFTPHTTCWDNVPSFECQEKCLECKHMFNNCNTCISRPKTAWEQMSKLAKEYLKDDIEFEFVASYIAIKPILVAREDDDGRPTLVIKHKEAPGLHTVFSGKLNTIYDLDSII